MELTPEEKRRIYEAEKARIEAERWQVYGEEKARIEGGRAPGPPRALRTVLIGLAVAIFVIVGMAGLIAGVIVPNINRSKQMIGETAAMENVKAIGQGQTIYAETTGKGSFADLRTLADEGLIGMQLGYGERSGYLFTSTPINIRGMAPMYDTTARPVSTGRFGTGNRSFGSNETNIVYEAPGSLELKGTLEDRAPLGGTAIQ